MYIRYKADAWRRVRGTGAHRDGFGLTLAGCNYIHDILSCYVTSKLIMTTKVEKKCHQQNLFGFILLILQSWNDKTAHILLFSGLCIRKEQYD